MDLLHYLKQNPEARERANKNKVIAKLVWDKYGLDMGIGKDKMADLVAEINSLDRKWRDILLKNPDLRGSDYKDKVILEEKKLIELGYDDKITP